MSLEDAIALARESGYETAVPRDDWHGMKVYSPVWGGEEIPCTGYAIKIFETDSGVRFSTLDETFEYMGLPQGDSFD